jgi:hypothetical protein
LWFVPFSNVDSEPEYGKNAAYGDETSPKALVELISSIRRIAGTLEFPSASSTRSRDNSPHSDTGSNSNATNNWSQSLLRAANVICEKITATNSPQTNNSNGNEDPMSVGSKNNRIPAGLPPRPPSSNSQQKNRENPTWKLFTPQLTRRQNLANVSAYGNHREGRNGDNRFLIENSKVREERREAKEMDKNEGENKPEMAYRKFIYQGPPLKAVNNQQQQRGTERKSRASRTMPRSTSSQPNSSTKSW